jgi:hypothetical protein
LYSSPNIIRIIRSRRMDKMGKIYRTHGEKGMHRKFWWESQKERDHQEHLDVSGRIILK